MTEEGTPEAQAGGPATIERSKRYGPTTGKVNLIEATVDAIKRIFDISGRSSRSAYWWFQLSGILALFLLMVIVGVLPPGPIGAVVAVLIVVPWFVASLTLLVRRMHDIGRTGWWAAASFLPLVSYVVLYFTLKASVGDNRWGTAPD